MDIKLKHTVKCVGCGEDRPCYIESHGLDRLRIDGLKCILDETNQTGYCWEEVSVDDVNIIKKESELLNTNSDDIDIGAVDVMCRDVLEYLFPNYRNHMTVKQYDNAMNALRSIAYRSPMYNK